MPPENKDLKQIKQMVIGSVIIMLVSMGGNALMFYSSTKVEIENLKKEDARLDAKHEHDMSGVQNQITSILLKTK